MPDDLAQPAAPRDRRRLPPEDRRAQIVAGAISFFAEVGLEGTTRDLAQRLGVTQSLLFNYFANKADLLEAVYAAVYLDRLSPDWPALIADRSLPLRARMVRFYTAYTRAIFTYEWMRIFMFSGLAGAELNRRYLGHLRGLILEPLRAEIAAQAVRPPDMEDIWNLHGGIVYIGIRRFVYQVPTPEDDRPAIEAAIDRFLAEFMHPPAAASGNSR
ncbi:MAG: TetR/AcrR family transcriptional regulator [Gemmobacter sp.]